MQKKCGALRHNCAIENLALFVFSFDIDILKDVLPVFGKFGISFYQGKLCQFLSRGRQSSLYYTVRYKVNFDRA